MMPSIITSCLPINACNCANFSQINIKLWIKVRKILCNSGEFWLPRIAQSYVKNYERRYLALDHFFSSNFFELLIVLICENKDNSLKEWWFNYKWKFLFRFLSILLHIKRASRKIWDLAQGSVLDSCLKPYICISANTESKIFVLLINVVCS